MLEAGRAKGRRIEAEMSGSIYSRVLDCLGRADRSLSALEIARSVGVQTRKQINPTLYTLERDGKIRKVGDVPAIWSLTTSPSQCPSNQRQETLGNTSLEPTTPVGSGVEGQVVIYLSKSGKPCTALEIAKALGYKSRKEINPYLYDMSKNGFITCIDGKGAPQWCVPFSQQDTIHSGSASFLETPDPKTNSAAGLSSIPLENVKERLLSILNTNPGQLYTGLELSKQSGCELGRREIETHLQQLQHDGRVKASQSVPVQWSSANAPHEDASIAMETESSMEENLLAALRSKPGIGQTSLELATCIGMNATRRDVNSCMANLQRQGRVRCLVTQPQQWQIVDKANNHTSTSTTSIAASPINDLTRNPVSALNEYCQSKQLEFSFPVVREYGPPHRKTFVIAAKFGDSQFEAKSSNTREAKRMAADLALQSVRASAYNITLPAFSGTPDEALSQPTSFCDKVAAMSHSFYTQLQQGLQHPQPGRKVIAAFIMENTERKHMEVVSIGSGTHFITGDNISCEGIVVNDSHAEVVARRSLMRFFYKELLEKVTHGSTVFIDSETTGLVQISDKLKLHLYISTAPCGDGGLFSRSDDENRVPPSDDSHKPTMHNKKQGILRTKLEGGEGTIPVGESSEQTWDGILRGERLRTMSCSDKILRWNVLGLQGALLGHFMKPVYMSSLTLGSLHHHGHLSRAVCCRAKELEGQLPTGFTLNHPILGRTHGGDKMERHIDKTSSFSLNWAAGDEKAELTDGLNGRPVLSSEFPSRISKASLFSSFATLCRKSECSDVCFSSSYSDAKTASLSYQQAKLKFFEHLRKKGYGSWVKKPEDLQQFTQKTTTDSTT